ncbi:MAG: hypothetical protein HXX20_02575 [Chloroflexi bacterium]|nr:hypothetical protein [Chloroflexota bacterium]
MVGSVSKKITMKILAMLMALLLLAGLLVACGETNANTSDLSFTLPLYSGLNELPALASAPNFVNKVLPSNDPSFTERTKFSEGSIRVFSTNSALTEVKSFYVTQLVNLGWNNRTVTLMGADTLSTEGWVLGFEKLAGNNTNRSRGLFMVGPNSNGTDNFLKTFRDSGAIPSGQNLLVVIDGLYSPNGTPAAPTATPRP